MRSNPPLPPPVQGHAWQRVCNGSNLGLGPLGALACVPPVWAQDPECDTEKYLTVLKEVAVTRNNIRKDVMRAFQQEPCVPAVTPLLQPYSTSD